MFYIYIDDNYIQIFEMFASSQGKDGFCQIRGDAARDVLNTRRVRSGKTWGEFQRKNMVI